MEYVWEAETWRSTLCCIVSNINAFCFVENDQKSKNHRVLDITRNDDKNTRNTMVILLFSVWWNRDATTYGLLTHMRNTFQSSVLVSTRNWHRHFVFWFWRLYHGRYWWWTTSHKWWSNYSQGHFIVIIMILQSGTFHLGCNFSIQLLLHHESKLCGKNNRFSFYKGSKGSGTERGILS